MRSKFFFTGSKTGAGQCDPNTGAIRTQMAVQVKRLKRNIRSQEVQQVRGSLGTHEQGLIVTTSDFSKGAQAEAEQPDAVPVALMNGEQLALLLAENEIGASRRSHDIIELDDSDSATDPV